MADLNHTKTKHKWQQYDPEDLLDLDDMDDDEELLFADDEDDGEDVIDAIEADDLEEETSLNFDSIPSWRRIEMAREDRFLKMAMADFEDYDSFEDFGGSVNAGFSH